MWHKRMHAWGVVSLVAACAGGEVAPEAILPDVAPPSAGSDPFVPATPDLPTQGEAIGEAPMLRPAIPVVGERSEAGATVLSPDEQVAYLVDRDNGLVHRFDLSKGGLTSLAVGGEPTRIVRAGTDLWVTLREAGQVVRLRDEGGALVELDRVDVGAEPYGLALAPAEPWLFVALSQEDAVLALDARTLEPLARWPAPGEPKWLATMPDGELVVVPARIPHVGRYIPRSGVIGWSELPSLRRFEQPECSDRHVARRVTGDPAVDARTGRVLLPLLLADTDLRGAERRGEDPSNGHTGFTGQDTFPPPDDVEPVPEPGPNGTPDRPPEPGCFEDDGSGSYGSSGDAFTPGALGRLTPVLVAFDVQRMEMGQVYALGANLQRDDAFDPATGLPFTTARSYPGAVHLGDGGRTAWVPLPGSGAFVGVHLDVEMPDKTSTQLRSMERGAFEAGLGVESVLPLTKGRKDGLLLSSPLERTVVVGTLDAVFEPDPMMPAQGRFEAAVSAAFPLSSLPADVQQGRLLFHTTTDQRMAAASSGVSCETCHTDGRNDGFTWVFDDMPRQTPSLAGPVTDTLPLTWLGNVATIVDEVHATTTGRMGGRGLADAEAAKVAAYVAWTRSPVRPEPQTDGERQRVARGEALFASKDVGCARCHSGEAAADGRSWSVLGFDERTNTPTLRGIGGSAPYFHDGSAATLRDVLLRVRDGSMGDTSALSDDELDDLEAYLRTL